MKDQNNNIRFLILTLLKVWIGICVLLSSNDIQAQETAKVQVVAIEIEGNKKTKEPVILRELDFIKGDSILISELSRRLEINQQNVQNTGLFVTSEIKIIDWNTIQNRVVIQIIVRETWYIYPYLIFELADRNFNVWWSEQNRSLKRVNYGVSLRHNNLTGRRDKFKLTYQGGYTQKYELDYNLPGINKRQTIGLFGNIYYIRQREISYITDENKLLFYDFEENYQLKRLRLNIGATLRPKLYEYHTFKIQWSDNEIGETVSQDLNPRYFLNGTNRQQHFTFWYQFVMDKRDIRPFPLNGFIIDARLQKDGFGVTDDVNSMWVSLKGVQYFTFGKKKKFSTELFGKIKSQLLRKELPFTHITSLGYGNSTVRGYELYVIDGMDYGLLKTSLRYEVLNKQFSFGKYMPMHAFRVVPIRVYFSIHNDLGYLNSVYYKDYGTLHNQWLWGTGVGLNIVVYHDKVFRIEYSRNHLGEKGLFLNFNFSG